MLKKIKEIKELIWLLTFIGGAGMSVAYFKISQDALAGGQKENSKRITILEMEERCNNDRKLAILSEYEAKKDKQSQIKATQAERDKNAWLKCDDNLKQLKLEAGR